MPLHGANEEGLYLSKNKQKIHIVNTGCDEFKRGNIQFQRTINVYNVETAHNL